MKVLVADDEKDIRRLVVFTLERAGFEIVEAVDGQEAFQMATELHPDIILLDVMMPYMDGFEVLRHIRKDVATRDLPVIMLTAKAMDNDVFTGHQLGATCYLTKPFNPIELISFVKRIFEFEDQEADDRYHL